MAIVTYNIISVSNDSTINELIVVNVLNNQIKPECRVNEFYIFLIQDQYDDVIGNRQTNLFTKYFLIFI